MTDTDVAVVGAGVAGLACAGAIRAAGRRCTLLEASGRIGGRAWTTHPAALHGAAFDHGASWLHAAERNPLVPIARAHGDGLTDSVGEWSRCVMVDGRAATDADLAAYARAEARFERLVTAAAENGPDRSMAEAVAPMEEDPWLATIETFEATLIAAADSRALSVQDAHLNALEGSNLGVEGGLGALVERRLGTSEVALGTAVRAIDWDERGATLHTTGGTLRAGACVVTVSTGVLRAGGIGFTPALPDGHAAALEALPMGVLTKVALRLDGDDPFGLPRHCALHGRVAPRHAPAMFFVAWPRGARHVIGFVGGTVAEDLSRQGEAAAAAFARAEVGRLLGERAVAACSGSVVADWAADPWHRGAYAYATPGHAGARRILGQALAAGRLVFAGEAVAPQGLAGTVGGAYASGMAAARTVLASL